ncbi:Aldehyde/histidinol dehydrogenase [Chytridium lagenaria]|nr:Aldehyde/histidinol dehydrogenase [Chytridium lagenaria]
MAQKAFKSWAKVQPYERGRLLYKLADLMERDIDISGCHRRPDTLICLKPSQNLRYYAGWADKIHGKVVDMEENYHTFIKHEPFGVVGQIIPWNFPILMMAWKLGPALCTGNTIVMKTSEKTPLSALKPVSPAGVVNVITGFGPTAGEAIARHMDIRKVAFTGSTATGRRIMAAAATSNLKKVSLELGGKSPNIVFDDADIDNAVAATKVGFTLNHGQCCCAGTRVYVQGRCLRQVYKAGAKVEYGGDRHGSKGFFVTPTIFSEVHDDMKVVQEEIFGPVVCVLKFKTVEEISSYGLAAAVHTKNLSIAHRVANELHSGTVWVNTYNVLSEQMPFGGYKESGFGRENSELAIYEYTQTKSVVMAI